MRTKMTMMTPTSKIAKRRTIASGREAATKITAKAARGRKRTWRMISTTK